MVRVFVGINYKKTQKNQGLRRLVKMFQCHHKRQYKNQSAQIEGAVTLSRTYKSCKYRFSIYKTRSEEFESILHCKRRACGEPALGAPRTPPPILSGPGAQHGDSRRDQGKKGNVSSGEVFDDEYSMKGPFCPFTVATRDCSRHGARSTGQLRGEAPADLGAGQRVRRACRTGPGACGLYS